MKVKKPSPIPLFPPAFSRVYPFAERAIGLKRIVEKGPDAFELRDERRG